MLIYASTALPLGPATTVLVSLEISVTNPYCCLQSPITATVHLSHYKSQITPHHQYSVCPDQYPEHNQIYTSVPIISVTCDCLVLYSGFQSQWCPQKRL